MTWLLRLFPGQWMIYAAVLAASFTAGGTAAWWVQGSRLDTVKAEYAGFVATTKAIGEAAQKVSDENTAEDRRNKLKADNENYRTLATLRADNKRLRNGRSSSNFVPPAPTGASRPDLATFDRAELESALQRFDSEVSGIIDQGSETTVNLDTAKRWAVP